MESMAGAERNNLLLRSLQISLHIIPHSNILFDGIVPGRRNIYRAVQVEGQTLSNIFCIALIGLNRFTLLLGHSRRSQDNACYPVFGELVIKGVSKAACLVTTNKIAISATRRTNTLHVF